MCALSLPQVQRKQRDQAQPQLEKTEHRALSKAPRAARSRPLKIVSRPAQPSFPGFSRSPTPSLASLQAPWLWRLDPPLRCNARRPPKPTIAAPLRPPPCRSSPLLAPTPSKTSEERRPLVGPRLSSSPDSWRWTPVPDGICLEVGRGCLI
jgi:hypothetical protein